jgi:hypothetical protein
MQGQIALGELRKNIEGELLETKAGRIKVTILYLVLLAEFGGKRVHSLIIVDDRRK